MPFFPNRQQQSNKLPVSHHYRTILRTIFGNKIEDNLLSINSTVPFAPFFHKLFSIFFLQNTFKKN